MVGKLIALLIFLSLAAPLQAQSPTILDAARSAMYGAVGADLGTTLYGIQKDNRREVNPVMTGLPLTTAALISTSIAVDLDSRLLWKHNHKRWAVGILIGIAAVHGFAAVHNLR